MKEVVEDSDTLVNLGTLNVEAARNRVARAASDVGFLNCQRAEDITRDECGGSGGAG